MRFAVPCLLLLAIVAAPLRAKPGENQLSAEAKAILEKSKAWELYSLDPAEKSDVPPGAKELGQTTITSAADRQRLLAALESSLASPNEYGARCFIPRHMLVAEHDGKKVKLVICFECSWIYVYLDGQEKPDRLAMKSDSAELDDAIKLFNGFLRQAKVPLPKG